jgi:hypothetical protein
MSSNKLLVFVLLCSASSFAQIAFVAGTVAGGTAVGASTCPMTTSPSAGSILVVATGNTSTQTVSSIACTGAVCSFSLGNRGTNTAHGEIWKSTAIPAGVTAVTVTFSANTTGACAVGEYTGVGTVGTTPTNSSGSTTTPNQAFTLTGANNWLASALVFSNGSGAASNTGNIRKTQANSTTISVSLVDNTAASATSVTNKITITSATWVGAGVQLILPVASSAPHQLTTLGVGQ